jgi:hypothetical protein
MNILAVPYLIKTLGYKFQVLKSHLDLKFKWLFINYFKRIDLASISIKPCLNKPPMAFL